MCLFQDNPPAEEAQIVDKILGVRMRKQAVGPKIEEEVQTLQVIKKNLGFLLRFWKNCCTSVKNGLSFNTMEFC